MCEQTSSDSFDKRNQGFVPTDTRGNFPSLLGILHRITPPFPHSFLANKDSNCYPESDRLAAKSMRSLLCVFEIVG